MKEWKEEDMTPSFPGHVKPVRDGVYLKLLPESKRWVWSRFSNGKWWFCSDSFEDAKDTNIPSALHDLKWRGLSKDPNR